MNLERMEIDDYQAIYELWRSVDGVGLNEIDDSKNGIAKYLNRNPKTCFIAKENGKILGTILSGHDGRRGFIYHLAVKESERKKGMGKKLVECALDALKNEGISKVALVVFRKNESGNIFWKNLEFFERTDLIYRNKSLLNSRSNNDCEC